MKVKNQYLKILEYLHLSFNKWPSIQYTFWISLVLWKLNNGEHCWLGNGPKDITERDGCSRSAVSKHIKCKVDWKKEIGYENVLKQQGWPQAWEYGQAKPIQTLGRASQGVNWTWNILLCVMNLYNIWISFSEISDKKYWPFSWHSHFWDTCLCIEILNIHDNHIHCVYLYTHIHTYVCVYMHLKNYIYSKCIIK